MKGKELSNREKLLCVIYEMSGGKQNTLKYEDISVKAFKIYPNDFQLRGYTKYPDTEHTSKRIYDLRKDGFIQIRSKFVTLTEKGITYARQIIKTQSKPRKPSKKLSRDIINEIERIKKTDSFQLFTTNKQDQIVDTDFFSYLGTTVRTERPDFRARIKTIEDVIETIKSNTEYKTIVDLHNYLFERFKDIIKAKLSIGYPKRKHE